MVVRIATALIARLKSVPVLTGRPRAALLPVPKRHVITFDLVRRPIYDTSHHPMVVHRARVSHRTTPPAQLLRFETREEYQYSSWSRRCSVMLRYWLMLSCSRRHLHHLGQRQRPPERPPPLLYTAQMQVQVPWAPKVQTAPAAQLLLFPLRPDLRRYARTPRARAAVRVAAARARHNSAGLQAGRGPHARRHGAAASPGGGWGGAREGGGRARRGSS